MNQNPVSPSSSGFTNTVYRVTGSPGFSAQGSHFTIGSDQTNSERSYITLKVLGRGSSSTVSFCDWQSPLPANAQFLRTSKFPTSNRIVALKRARMGNGDVPVSMIAEVLALRTIPPHPNVIPLYDYFRPQNSPSRDVYLVLEAMEGNLYQLIKARRGRDLAPGLISSMFHQLVLGFDHIHSHSFFHRDVMPENILVTTTSLGRYLTSADPGSTSRETDIVAVFKIGDFGAARQTTSRPPYTEYVCTRWYRAPEVLLLSRSYTGAVDMWALGAVMAEMVNLRPLFPGTDQVDQLSKICAVLGSPNSQSVFDDRGFPVGGGPWPAGISMAQDVGFQFPQVAARPFYSHFGSSASAMLVECIRGLLLYDPQIRLTSRDCLDHPYFEETEAMRQPLLQPVINLTQ